MNQGREVYAELRSFDSLEYFPHNNAASFRVQFDREMRFEGLWELALKAISVECNSKDRSLAGRNLYIYTDIIDFSFVGGSLKQILKRVSLRQGIKSDNRISYQTNETDKGCHCCYYKRVTIPHCLSIEIRIEDDRGNLFRFSNDCNVSMSIHFRQISKI